MVNETRGTPIRGRVAPGFERVGEVFTENFTERRELGAACAVYYQGRKVVDLWGGYRDRERTEPWEEETLVLVFSTTKGLASMAVAHARSVGLFEFDDRVARHWPAFRANGKGAITIRELLAHRAGLAAMDRKLTPADLRDTDGLSKLLAKKEPEWEPGQHHGYHAFTLGWYASELIRHADPYDRTLGEYFAQEIAQPFDLECYIGIPSGIPDERIAEIAAPGPREMLGGARTIPRSFIKSYLKPRSLTRRTMNCFDISSPAELNAPAYRMVEIPAANGIGQVRDIAKAYGKLATAEPELGIDRETRDELEALPDAPPAGAEDEVLKTETAYSLGYWKPSLNFDFGTNSAAFGAPGAGGSFAFADPEEELGFAYAPNRMGAHLFDDPREKAVRDAVYECVQDQ